MRTVLLCTFLWICRGTQASSEVAATKIVLGFHIKYGKIHDSEILITIMGKEIGVGRNCKRVSYCGQKDTWQFTFDATETFSRPKIDLALCVEKNELKIELPNDAQMFKSPTDQSMKLRYKLIKVTSQPAEICSGEKCVYLANAVGRIPRCHARNLILFASANHGTYCHPILQLSFTCIQCLL